MEILQTIWTALTTENEMFVNLFSIPYTLIESLVTILLASSLLNIKIDKKSVLIYIISLSTISILANYLLDSNIRMLVGLVSTIALMMIVFKVNILKAILALILPMLAILLSESIFIKLYTNMFHITQEEITLIPIYRETLALLDYGFIFLLYRIVKFFKLNINVIDTIDKKSKILLIGNSVFGLLAIVTQLYLINFYTQELSNHFIILSMVSLLIYFVISIYSVINTSKVLMLNMDLSQEKEHNRILKLAQDDLRGFRHDFSNIMCTIGGYVQVKDMDGLAKYYSEIQKDIAKVNNLGALDPAVINHPAIFTLLASKYNKATEEQITMNINCFLDLNDLNMKIYEFTRVLGILLDNAIEAAKECDEKIINVEIRKETNRNRQILIIENTYHEKDIDTNKIYEKNYSTKEGNTGLGLWEVRQILKRNHNLNLFTTTDDTYFKQQLEMYNQ